MGEELARLESDQLSGVWWDPLLSISGYANHLCVTVSAEQDLLDSSEDTVFNQSLFTSFEQDSVDFGSGTSETNEDVRDSINSVQGNLSKCYEFWKNTLSAPESVLNIISNGYVLPFKDQPPRKVFRNHSNCVKYEQFIDESIRDLVAERCAKPVKELPHVCNPLSVVCSRKGKLRLVLDLRYVNRYLWKCSFKYEDLHTVLSMFNCGDYVITFDLKSGYHHVDINEEHWRYLGFYWKEQHYVFKVLPFGLPTACYAFTKLLRPLVCYWCSRGIRAVLYIDDIIVAFSALELATGNPVAQVREDIGKAGLTLNVQKSCFTPSQQGVWLGFVLDFEKGKIHM